VTIGRETLDELTTLELRPAVSILMPTHHAGPEIRQDPIRFKNLVREVEHELDARDLEPAEIARIMGPAHALIDDRAFWRHQEQGLAMYAAPNFFRSYWAQRPFREIARISDHFHVTQLFPALLDGTRFYVLALSQKDVRLVEATRSSAAELELGDLPRSLAEAVPTEPPGQELQQHVVTTAGGERGVMFHGHGAGLLDQRKEEIRQFFHQLDRGLHSLLRDRSTPLVLAGVEYLLSIYREANSHPAVLPEEIPGNPELWSAQTLGSRGWEIVSRHLEAVEAVAVARYHERAGHGRTSADLATVVRASYEGRVEKLFVADGAERWGTFEPGSGAVSVRDKPGTVGEDLVNLASSQAFQRGGAVHVLERSHVPLAADMAAIFRYWSPDRRAGTRSRRYVSR
jgi:Bacterial archaeo-eukaryotic release factor family 3